MDLIINCIYSIARSKNQSMETFLNGIEMDSLKKLEKTVPLGTSGKVVYPSENNSVTLEKGDQYVKGLKDKLMLGYNYTNVISKRSADYPLMEKWNIPQPPVGWYMSEKFDGQRALWDGEKFVTRGSGSGYPRVYPYVPVWLIALMPPGIALDGEFYTSRNSFQEIGFLRSKLKNEKDRKKGDLSQLELDKKWINIKFQVFDLINDQPFEERQATLNEIVNQRSRIWEKISLPPYLKKGESPLIITKQYRIESEESLNHYYSELVSSEAEGVMIRAPHAMYIPRRTWLMLKLKPEEDAECIIVGYKPGEGKYSGMLGAFKCKALDSDKTWYISGMDDSIRTNYKKTHPVGTKITYKYTFLTDDGLPRHPRYKGIPGDR